MSAVPFAVAKTFIDLDSSRLSSAIEVKTQCISHSPRDGLLLCPSIIMQCYVPRRRYVLKE